MNNPVFHGYYADKRWAVAGGSGFLGSHLCDALIAQGSEVIVLDNYCTSKPANIEHLLNHPSFKLRQCDIRHPFALPEVDGVFNLACPASPQQYQKDPIFTLMTSVQGTFNILEWVKEKNIPLLHTSTSEVYGMPVTKIQDETYWGNVNPIGIRSCYDEGKRCAETLCFDYSRHHDVNAKVVRIFNTYGPKMQIDDGRVVSNFIVQAITGQDITVYGDGKQTRCFCYVDDMIDGIMRAMAAEKFDGPVNLGNRDEYTMLDLAQVILNLVGSQAQIRFGPLPQDDPLHRQPHLSRAETQLHWQPTTALKDGLLKTINYFRGVLPLK